MDNKVQKTCYNKKDCSEDKGIDPDGVSEQLSRNIDNYVGSDHIHLLVSAPSHLSASKLVQYINGKTFRKL